MFINKLKITLEHSFTKVTSQEADATGGTKSSIRVIVFLYAFYCLSRTI